MAEQQFCPDCGAPNPADATFCESCGHSIVATAGAAAPAPAQAATAAPAAARRGMPGWLMGLLGAIVVVAIARFVFPLQTAMLILSIEETLHIGPYAGTTSAAATTPDSTTAPLADVGQPLVRVPGSTRQPATPPPPPQDPTVKVVRPIDSPPPRPIPATGRDSIVVTRQSTPTTIPPLPPGSSGMTITRNDLPGAVVTTLPSTRPADPPPPPPPPAAMTRIAAGTSIVLKSSDKVCSDKNKVGDQFRAVVDNEVTGPYGGRIPKGTSVTFMVDQLKRSTNDKENTLFSVAPVSMQLNGMTYPLSGTIDSIVVKKNGKGLLGALVGAAAGVAATRAAGGNVGTAVAGGVVGGVAGGVVGSRLGNGDGCIDQNAYMRIVLRTDVPLSNP